MKIFLSLLFSVALARSGFCDLTETGTNSTMPNQKILSDGSVMNTGISDGRYSPKNVASFALVNVSLQKNTSPNTTANSRCGMACPSGYGVHDLQPVFDNSARDGNDGYNEITVRASIEYPLNKFYPVYFSGARDVVLQPGASATGDPVAVGIPAGSNYWIRTFVQVSTTNQFWPRSFITQNNGLTGWYYEGGSDLTTISNSLGGNWLYSFGPSAVLGKRDDGLSIPSIGVLGDSIINPNWQDGWMVNLLKPTFPFVLHSYGGLRIAEESANWRAGAIISKSCKYIVCQLGVNDVWAGYASSDTVKTNLVALWKFYAARGLKVYQTTITPLATSSDSFLSVSNQVPMRPGVLPPVNDWIRTVPAPLTGYFEIADTVESARNSEKWKVDGVTSNLFTSDGIHPTDYAKTLMTAAISTNVFK